MTPFLCQDHHIFYMQNYLLIHFNKCCIFHPVIGIKFKLWKVYLVKVNIHCQCFSSVTQSCLTLSDVMNCSTLGLPVHHQLPEFTQIHVHWVVSSSVVSCSSWPQSFPASGSFQMSQLFASGGQNIRVSASTSVLPMNIQDWFPLGWTGWISLQSKGLSRVFSNTTAQKHQFFGPQLSL